MSDGTTCPRWKIGCLSQLIFSLGNENAAGPVMGLVMHLSRRWNPIKVTKSTKLEALVSEPGAAKACRVFTCWKLASARRRSRPGRRRLSGPSSRRQRCSLSRSFRNRYLLGSRPWERPWTAKAGEIEKDSWSAGILRLRCAAARSFAGLWTRADLFRRYSRCATAPGSWSRGCRRGSRRLSRRHPRRWHLKKDIRHLRNKIYNAIL